MWHHVGVPDKARQGNDDDGYVAVAHQDAVAFNTGAKNAQFWPDTDFSLIGGNFAAAWNVGLTMIVEAFRDGVKVATETYP